MEIRFEYIDDCLVAHLQCYLNEVGVENFKFSLNERIKENEKVILDLEKLVHIDNYGLDALLAVAQRAIEKNATIKLAKVSCDMQVVLDITKVYKVFEIYPTIEEAVASFKKGNV
jgi:anti-anti-sigma factor